MSRACLLFLPAVRSSPAAIPSRFASKRKDDENGSDERQTGLLSRAFTSRKLTKKDSPKSERKSWFGRARSESGLQDTQADTAPLNLTKATRPSSATSRHQEPGSPHTHRQHDSPLLKQSSQTRKDSILEDDEDTPVPSTRISDVRFTGLMLHLWLLECY